MWLMVQCCVVKSRSTASACMGLVTGSQTNYANQKFQYIVYIFAVLLIYLPSATIVVFPDMSHSYIAILIMLNALCNNERTGWIVSIPHVASSYIAIHAGI